MLVAVKAPHTQDIEFTMSGKVPPQIVSLTRELYGTANVEIDEDDNDLIDPFETDWFKNIKIDDTPGGNLRFYRQQTGMNQTQFAEKLGVKKQFLSNLERGIKPISKKMAIKVSKLLGVDVGKFIG